MAIYRWFSFSCCGALFIISAVSAAQSGRLTPDEARDLADEAYIFGYPAVLMHVTADTCMRQYPIGWNELSHVREFISPAFRTIVASNVDVLYSVAFLDLSEGPVMLHVPEMRGRYYNVHLLDGWTRTFGLFGTRTTGSHARAFVITGPGWNGVVPVKAHRIDAPTDFVWMIIRIEASGPGDFAEVHAAQNGFSLKSTAASRPGSRNFEADPKLTPVMQVNRMTAAEFLGSLAGALRTSQPRAEDAAMIAKLTRLGVQAGREFDLLRWTKPLLSAADAGVRNARRKVETRTAENRRPLGGNWLMGERIPRTQFIAWARLARFGLGALPPEEALYAQAYVDAEGAQLNGSRRYMLRFEAGQFPPVNAFWSVTMYGPDSYFVENPIGRYAIRDRDPAVRGADGSLEIYIQNKPSVGKESNWLPAPAGDFHLSLRMYWPRKEIADGTWHAPPVRRLD